MNDVLMKSLRDGNGTKTTFMSNEERRFMWNLALVLAVKHPSDCVQNIPHDPFVHHISWHFHGARV